MERLIFLVVDCNNKLLGYRSIDTYTYQVKEEKIDNCKNIDGLTNIKEVLDGTCRIEDALTNTTMLTEYPRVNINNPTEIINSENVTILGYMIRGGKRLFSVSEGAGKTAQVYEDTLINQMSYGNLGLANAIPRQLENGEFTIDKLIGEFENFDELNKSELETTISIEKMVATGDTKISDIDEETKEATLIIKQEEVIDGVYEVPTGVEKIGFLEPGELNITTVIVPDCVQEISSKAFIKFKDLRTVWLGSGITKIQSGTFNCKNLYEIHMTPSVKTIEDNSFRYGQAIRIYIPYKYQIHIGEHNNIVWKREINKN